ncbi:MAG: hypothetical protein DRO93_01475 [Candidatus Thorarchaeota archaeon]|nr:MAG: hypothetical protein DRO93_01475 [Candidatus Thorarchaeota archaeon]
MLFARLTGGMTAATVRSSAGTPYCCGAVVTVRAYQQGLPTDMVDERESQGAMPYRLDLERGVRFMAPW